MDLKDTIYKFDITQLRHDQLSINYHLLNYISTSHEGGLTSVNN
jgi:hypothetical protein